MKAKITHVVDASNGMNHLRKAGVNYYEVCSVQQNKIFELVAIVTPCFWRFEEVRHGAGEHPR